MVNAKKSEYFTFNIQEKSKTTKALCFSPKKHKMNVERKAESGTPCKVTKYAPHAFEENVIWINACTKIDDAQETTVDFAPYDTAPTDPQLCSTTNLDSFKPNQSITIRGYLMFGDAQTEQVKHDLVKKDGYLIDEDGRVRITLFNEHIQQASAEGYYEIKDIHVKKYLGEAYLSCAKSTTFTVLTNNVPTVSDEIMKQVQSELINVDVPCQNILTVEMDVFYSCLSCTRKVSFQPGSNMLRCTHCQSRFLVKNSTKIFIARFQLRVDAEQTKWYSLFTASLQQILECYNRENVANETLDSIDEDVLCEYILTSLMGRLTFKVNARDTVVGITIV